MVRPAPSSTTVASWQADPDAYIILAFLTGLVAGLIAGVLTGVMVA